MKIKALLASMAVAALAIPSLASAHTASVVCDKTTGKYVVSTDYNNLNPLASFNSDSVTITWSDNYKVVKLLPKPCEAPVINPEPPVSTPNTEPPVVAPEPPVVTPKPRVKKSKPPLTCKKFKASHPKAGVKAYAKVGLRYYECNIPKPRVVIPPVAG